MYQHASPFFFFFFKSQIFEGGKKLQLKMNYKFELTTFTLNNLKLIKIFLDAKSHCFSILLCCLTLRFVNFIISHDGGDVLVIIPLSKLPALTIKAAERQKAIADDN